MPESQNRRIFSRGIRILYVEDRVEDEELVTAELKRSGLQFELQRVDNEQTFLSSITSKEYDLVFSDYGLPGWNGMEALKTLRAHRPDLPFILITGTLGEDAAVECIKSGAADYLLKGNLSRLAVAVRRALRERQDRLLRQRAELELRESEEQYRLLFDANPNPMWVYDIETLRFLAVNNAAVCHYGFSHEEFLSMTIKEIRPKKELAAFMEEYESWDKTQDIDFGTWKHAKKDGTPITVEVRSRAIVFQNRKARLVMAHDVTEKLRAEEERRASQELFASVFYSSPAGITISTSEQGRYLAVNGSFSKIIGYEHSELIGKTSLELNIWVDPSRRAEIFKKLMKNKIVIGFDAEFRNKSGNVRQVQISASHIQFRDTECLLAFTNDVTDQKILQRQFQQAQRMESVGRLAAGVAHDFNNLLMVIGSSAELLDDAKDDQARQKHYVDYIKSASNKAASLTRQLLAFSRQQVLQPRTFELNTVIEDMWKILPRLLGEDIEMVKHLDPSTGRVNADPGQLEQVVMNLAVNARDAMPRGGKLTIETKNVELDGGYAQRHSPEMRPGPYVMLSITDTGSGMDQETQTRIFEPFFTTKEVGKGTGLGLATVYGIVKQSGGFIWVYSEVGKGTTFKVYLPRVDGPSETTREAARTYAKPSGPKTVLLVEDEGMLRDGIAEYLRSLKHTVIIASSGPEAEKASNEFSGRIDLLITDMVMPGFGGFDVSKKIRQNRPDIRIIHMSGYTDRSLDPSALEPFAIFLQKPFMLEALGQRIESLFQ